MRFAKKEGEIFRSFEAVHFNAGHKIIKYGASTRLTSGTLTTTGAAIAIEPWNPKDHPRENIRLHQQIEVISHFRPNTRANFCVDGDSGAMVYSLSNDGNKLGALGLLVGGTTYGSGIVTPIWAILDSFGLSKDLLVFDEQRFERLYKEIKGIKGAITEVENRLSEKIDNLSDHINKSPSNS